jgi:hypothetical protein
MTPASRRKRSGFLYKLRKSIVKIDLYGEAPSFNIDGDGSYGTVHGAFVSLAMMLLVLLYAYFKWTIMFTYEDTKFTERVIVNEGFDEQRSYSIKELDLDFVIVVETDMSAEDLAFFDEWHPGLNVSDYIKVDAYLFD